MAEVKWVKLTVDMFDNRKIKQIRSLPEGNNIVLVWIMLLTIAGRCNAGGMIFLTENIAYTAESLAVELGFELSTVKLALEALSRYGMIVCDSEQFYITNWEEYQNKEGLDKIREDTRKRVQAYRERQKGLLDSNVTLRNVTGNGEVTQSNETEIELERESEREIDNKKKKDKKEKDPFEIFSDGNKELLGALMEFEKMRKQIKKPMSDRAKQLLVGRLQKFPEEDWIDIINQSILHSWDTVYALKKEDGYAGGNRKNKRDWDGIRPDVGDESKYGS